ncbi:ferredoxin family protein [bacterium]|nr:ferredoxin family protein [candidate division CSSED10-310 bacterium]
MGGDSALSKVKKVKAIRIREEWCKGCGLCVEVCPKHVLVMNRFKATVADLDACIVCCRCEDICPDFCLEVIPEDFDQQE